jgi:hypothetical protein
MAVKLGTEVTDRYTGYKGLARSRVLFLSGCVKVCVIPKELKDGLRQDHDWLDEADLLENDATQVEPHFLMGKLATDSISGFKGIVVAFNEHMNAEPRLSIQPEALTKEGVPIAAIDFDESQIKEVMAARKAAAKVPGKIMKATSGGPRSSSSSARQGDRMPSR